MRRLTHALMKLAFSLPMLVFGSLLGSWIGAYLECWFSTILFCGYIGRKVGAVVGTTMGLAVAIIAIQRFKSFQRRRTVLLEAEQEPNSK